MKLPASFNVNDPPVRKERDVPCTYCGAQAGELCLALNGERPPKRVQGVHVPRRMLYRKVKKFQLATRASLPVHAPISIATNSGITGGGAD